MAILAKLLKKKTKVSIVELSELYDSLDTLCPGMDQGEYASLLLFIFVFSSFSLFFLDASLLIRYVLKRTKASKRWNFFYLKAFFFKGVFL